jgi:putative membrane protein
MLRVTLAATHLIALGLGLGAVVTRGNALREPVSTNSLRRALRADGAWGLAAAVWLATGLWRLLGETEKAVGYYLHNSLFITKMGLFAVVLALEIWPMVMLTKWRRALQRSNLMQHIVAPATARRIATISYIEALLILLMVFAASAMARGLGVRS